MHKLIQKFKGNKRLLHGKQFIGNQLSDLGVTKKSPKNNNVQYIEATDEEIQKACTLAEKTAKIYRNESLDKVVNFLETMHKNLAKREEPIIIMAMNETSLPRPRLTGEFQRTLFQIKHFTEAIKDGSFKDVRIKQGFEPGKVDLRRMLIPIGPVLVFGASNFPLAYSTIGGDTVSALATQNPVIVKAHPAHLGTCELVAETIQDSVKEANMPEGVFSMLHGEESVGSKLVMNPSIKAIGFTGSLGGGRAIFDLANKRPFPIPVYAELGSVNPVFVLPNALKEKGKQIAIDYANSFTVSCGQFCTNPGLLFLIGDEKKEFYESFLNTLEKIPPHRMLTNGIQKSFIQGVKTFSSLCELVRQNQNEDDKMGAVSLKINVKNFIKDIKILSQEVFGPVSIIIECSTLEEAKEAYSHIEGQLSTSIHATEKDIQHSDFKDLLDLVSYNVGRVIFNGFPTGLDVSSPMHHGGPYPASTDIRTGAVGATALSRWVRPICYQGFGEVQHVLNGKLKDIPDEQITLREVNGKLELKN